MIPELSGIRFGVTAFLWRVGEVALRLHQSFIFLVTFKHSICFLLQRMEDEQRGCSG